MLEFNLRRVVSLLTKNFLEGYECVKGMPKCVSTQCSYIYGDIFDRGKLTKVTYEDDRETYKTKKFDGKGTLHKDENQCWTNEYHLIN